MESDAEIWILGAVLAVAGLVVVVVGRRQEAGTLRRNWIAGLRTHETMRSDAAWYAAHDATWRQVTAAGLVLLATAVAVMVVRPSDDATLAAIVLGGAAITLTLVVAAGIRGHRIAARVNRAESDDTPPGDHPRV